jgi:hypothetical protein
MQAGSDGWRKEQIMDGSYFEAELAKQIAMNRKTKKEGKNKESEMKAATTVNKNSSSNSNDKNATTSSKPNVASTTSATTLITPPKTTAAASKPLIEQKNKEKVDLKAVAVADYNEEEVMKFIDNYQSDSGLLLSVFDFGGQKVFYAMHHLFIVKKCFFVIVFNMADLVSPVKRKVRIARDYLQFWIQSVVIHTLDVADNSTASVVFVGTHKDKISSSEEHDKISLIIGSLVENSPIQYSMIKNEFGVGAKGTTTHFMFPVDNTRGRSDPVIILLMNAIDQHLRVAPFVTQLKPISW